MTIHPLDTVTQHLFEYLPVPTLYWLDARSAAPHPNPAYTRLYPPHALPDDAYTWAGGPHVRRLPTHGGDHRFGCVRLSTLPGGTRLATIEDLHDYHTDALTGLLDRRALHHDLATQAPGGVVLLDIDGLKTINDALGHAAGDDVLCALGRLLTCIAQTWHGHAYRLGGDEFLLHTPRPIPAIELEQLQQQFQWAAWRLGVKGGHVSAGTAHALQHGNTIQHLILHADAQLSETRQHRRGGAVRHLNLDKPPPATEGPVRRPRGWVRP